MKRLLLAGIRSYWRLVPPAKRRTCLFALSCSRHVFDVTEREGFAAGISALLRRYHTCRPGYTLLHARDQDGTRLMLLADGSVVRIDLLSTHVLPDGQDAAVPRER